MKKCSPGVEENPPTHSTPLPPVTKIPLGNAAPPEVWSRAVGFSLLPVPIHSAVWGASQFLPLEGPTKADSTVETFRDQSDYETV